MTRVLDVVEDYLDWRGFEHLRLDGAVSSADRGDLVQRFNAPGTHTYIRPASCTQCRLSGGLLLAIVSGRADGAAMRLGLGCCFVLRQMCNRDTHLCLTDKLADPVKVLRLHHSSGYRVIKIGDNPVHRGHQNPDGSQP